MFAFYFNLNEEEWYPWCSWQLLVALNTKFGLRFRCLFGSPHLRHILRVRLANATAMGKKILSNKLINQCVCELHPYRFSIIIPSKGLFKLIVVWWQFIVVPIREFIKNTTHFECSFGIFIEWSLILLEDNTTMWTRYLEIATIQREATQRILQNCKQTHTKLARVKSIINKTVCKHTNSHQLQLYSYWNNDQRLQ